MSDAGTTIVPYIGGRYATDGILAHLLQAVFEASRFELLHTVVRGVSVCVCVA